MDGNGPLATAMVALLLISSLTVLATVRADGNDNLYIETFNYDYSNTRRLAPAMTTRCG